MKQLNEYFSQSEKVSLISEYLLSKTKKPIYVYYVVLPIDEVFFKAQKLYKKKSFKVKTNTLYILDKNDILNLLNGFNGNTQNKCNIFKIPNEYDEDTVKNALQSGKITYWELKKININDIQ